MTRKSAWRFLAAALLAAVASAALIHHRTRAEQAGVRDREHYIEHQGRQRKYVVHVPRGYDGRSPLPVVVALHGGASNAATMQRQSRLNETADRHGFLVVYPEGTGRLRNHLLTFNAGSCCGYAVTNKIDDVGFIRKMLDELPRHYAVDSGRVYATGMSNGAMLAYRLACELPDRIAAIAPVAGAMGVDGPRPDRPVPIIHFHGALDQNAPFAGGVGPNSISPIPHRSVPETIQWWCETDGCDPTAPQVERRPDVTIERYLPQFGAPGGGAPIMLYKLNEGGHTWPGGVDVTKRFNTGKLVETVNANELMWEFFRQFSLGGGT